MAELLVETPKRALAIYAHPDDPEVSCGGTLASWARSGCDVHVLLCTKGEKGTTDPAISTDELAELRAGEARAAAAIVGVSELHSLGHPDGELIDGLGLISEIVAVVRKVRPLVVLCPDPTALIFGEDYVNHRDHRVLGACVLDALAFASALPHYFPEAGSPHQVGTVLLSGTLQPSVWVDVGSTIEEKVAAVACHKSQLPNDAAWAEEAVRERAREEGRKVGVLFAEGFRRVRLGS
jgi:LmbE family N-acetylglucosaminyl deacetylase